MNQIFIFISFVLFVVYEPSLSNSDPGNRQHQVGAQSV